jgi:RNA polymerase sigma-70 factor (ECF subfamily)
VAVGSKSASFGNISFANLGAAIKRRRTSEAVVSSTSAVLSRDHFMETLYKDHWNELCARLRKQFGSGPPEAEDIAQAAFAKISAIDDLGSIQHPRAFLFRTALNLGLNAKDRQNTAKGFVDQALAEAGSPIVEQNGPETVYVMRQRLVLVEKAMKKLSEKQRTILMRHRINGETYSEISASTGWSKADISRQLAATLKVLETTLAADDG